MSGIIGFALGGSLSFFSEHEKLQKLYDLSNSCFSLAETSLGRDNPAYIATYFLEVINSPDPEMREGFAELFKPQVIQYAAELKIAIDKSEDDNEQGIQLYKDTLARIESLLDIEAHNKSKQQGPLDGTR